MEVHVPEEPVMTWRQFFIHMGIVVLGLLIAISLEQTVEWLHHRHQRHELREAIQRDLEQSAHDAKVAGAYYEALAARDGRAVRETQAAFRHGGTPVALAPVGGLIDWSQPVDSSFQAAKSSGVLALLSQDEVRVFSEVDAPTQQINSEFDMLNAVRNRLNEFHARFGEPGSAGNTWADAAPDDVRRYMAVLAETQQQERQVALLFVIVRVASEQALKGERNLQTIYSAENAEYLEAMKSME